MTPVVLTLMGALTLEDAVSLARARNEAPQIASAQATAAAARLERARAFFFPDLTATFTYTRRAYQVTRDVGGQQVIVQSQNALNGNATLNAVLFDARGIPLYRAAAADREAADFDARDAQRLTAFEAADAFLQTLALQQVREAAVRRLDLAKQSLADARSRFEAQLVSSNDVTKSQLELANAEQQLNRSVRDAESARLELGYVLGSDAPAELVEPAEPKDAPEPKDSLFAQALNRRPDVLAASARARSARLLAQEPLARLFPLLGLTAQIRGTNEAGLSGNAVDGFAALTLSWILFDGGERYADRHERVALTHVAELQVQALQRRAQTQVSTALVAIDSARANVTRAQDAVKAAKKNSDEVAELYRQGLASALDAQDARVQLFEAEVAQARSGYDLQLAHLGLRSATGRDPFGAEVTP